MSTLRIGAHEEPRRRPQSQSPHAKGRPGWGDALQCPQRNKAPARDRMLSPPTRNAVTCVTAELLGETLPQTLANPGTTARIFITGVGTFLCSECALVLRRARSSRMRCLRSKYSTTSSHLARQRRVSIRKSMSILISAIMSSTYEQHLPHAAEYSEGNCGFT